jgi:hypothetical protein
MRSVQHSLFAIGLLAPLIPMGDTIGGADLAAANGQVPPAARSRLRGRYRHAIVGGSLDHALGQPVVVENRPGGDAIVAISAFVSAHDDHILLSTPTSSFTAHPYLHDNLPYKPSDLLPIARVSNTLITIGTHLPERRIARGTGRAGALAARQAQLGGRYRRPRFLVHRIFKERP